MARSSFIKAPQQGEIIKTSADSSISVPDCPIIPFIEGDGIGVDVTPVMRKVIDTAVQYAYDSKRRIEWMEIYAGRKSCGTLRFGPMAAEETYIAINKYSIAIKGPLTTPVGGGIRSLNVAIRQQLDLFACVRPILISPARRPRSKILRRPIWSCFARTPKIFMLV